MSVASRLGRRHRRHEEAELNITAFMNLMVVLVPFLLITAVFSRLTILELNLPSSSEATPERTRPPSPTSFPPTSAAISAAVFII